MTITFAQVISPDLLAKISAAIATVITTRGHMLAFMVYDIDSAAILTAVRV
jgi:hypothetical protein